MIYPFSVADMDWHLVDAFLGCVEVCLDNVLFQIAKKFLIVYKCIRSVI